MVRFNNAPVMIEPQKKLQMTALLSSLKTEWNRFNQGVIYPAFHHKYSFDLIQTWQV